MKNLFYKYSPLILGAVGIIVSLFIYFLYGYFTQGGLHLLFWTVVVLFQAFLSVNIGILIKKLHKRTNIDPLTGLYNRRCFYDILNYEMERVIRTNSALSLAIIDVDNFKNINDVYGHLEGDKVLKALSCVLKQQTRSIDTLVRWGGEEFTIIFPETTSEGARVVAERIRKSIENYNLSNKVTVCIGITTTSEYLDIDKFVALADQAMYKAKEKKNLVVCL